MLNNLKEIIADKWEVTGTSKNKLIEKQASRIITEVNISTAGQYLLYKFEENGHIQMPYLKSNKNVKKISDYVLFTIDKGVLYVLIFELKNGNGHPLKQLEATEILTKYLIETANRVSKISFNNVKYRRIGITNRSIKMNLRPSKIYDKNNYARIANRSKLDIKVLCE